MRYAGRMLGLAATLLGASHPAVAQPVAAQPELPIRLQYRAPPACPPAADFEHAVRRFLPKLAARPAGAAQRRVEVEIGPDGLRGVLAEPAPEGGTRTRAASGQTCAEVAEILAFAVALTIDPEASVPPELAAKLGASSPEPAAATAPAQASQAAARAEPSVVAAPRSAKPSEPEGGEVDWAVSASGFVMTAPAPRVSVGGALSVDAAWRLVGGVSSMRLGASYLTSKSVVVDSATVSFRNWLAVLELCPRVWGGPELRFGLCVRVDGGVRIASAEDIPSGRSRPRPWLDLGPTAHARWFPRRHLFFDLGLGATFTAVQDRVYLRPDTTVHDAPSWGFLGELALGVDFGDQSPD